MEVGEYYSYSILVKNKSIETYYSSIGSSTVLLVLVVGVVISVQ